LLIAISDNSEIAKPIITNDTLACITAIRNYKKELNAFISKYLKIKTKWVVSSLIIALILYVYLRATIK